MRWITAASARVDPALRHFGLRNILKQANGNPVSYTFTFARPVSSFQFRRAPLHAGPTGVTNPPWTADAHAADGGLLAKVSEDEIASYVDVAGRTFLLAGDAPIQSVTISGDDHQFDGQANAVLDLISWCP